MNAYRSLVVKPEGKGSLERSGRIWEDNIRMNIREIGWDGMDWFHLAQDMDQWRRRAIVNTVINFWVP
jgi:hypothetical protein